MSSIFMRKALVSLCSVLGAATAQAQNIINTPYTMIEEPATPSLKSISIVDFSRNAVELASSVADQSYSYIRTVRAQTADPDPLFFQEAADRLSHILKKKDAAEPPSCSTLIVSFNTAGQYSNFSVMKPLIVHSIFRLAPWPDRSHVSLSGQFMTSTTSGDISGYVLPDEVIDAHKWAMTQNKGVPNISFSLTPIHDQEICEKMGIPTLTKS